MPQLIIGLDSLDDDANYIHVDDAKDDLNYYCPCCKGLIKPRAYKKDEDYQVQPHFYHVDGGCKEETFVHYICKEWLFVHGCKFIVNGITYEVDSVEIEKTLHTPFGNYRPGIIVTTTYGKTFYFEIKTSNKKTELYAPKWDKLGNDVVEVDTRYFINQKYNHTIPVFDLIYSDGKCYIKSYTKKDYDDIIGDRKIKWKRQDKLNYKIQWEKLDWFWDSLSRYKKNEYDKSDVVDSFGLLDISDRIWCYNNICRKFSNDLKHDFADNINKYYFNVIDDLKNKFPDLEISLEHKSKLIYILHIKKELPYRIYDTNVRSDRKIRLTKGLFLPDINLVKRDIKILHDRANVYAEKLNDMGKNFSLEFVKYIRPSIVFEEEKDLSQYQWEVVFQDNIHNRFIKEKIGCKYYYIDEMSTEKISSDYYSLKRKALENLDLEIQKYLLLKDKELNQYINMVCKESKVVIRYGANKIYLLTYGRKADMYIIELFNHSDDYSSKETLFELNNNTDFTNILQTVKTKLNKVIRYYSLLETVVKKYLKKINGCKNHCWHIVESYDTFDPSYFPYSFRISLHNNNSYVYSYFSLKPPFTKKSIESQLVTVMNKLASGENGIIRLMEVNSK